MAASSFMYEDAPTGLRSQIREMISTELPSGWLGPFTDNPADKQISDEFCRKLADRGLLIPEWPAEFGGSGMSLDQGIVIREEMWAHSEPRGAQYYGPNWIGPSIMEHGTEEQKAQLLPAIAGGRVVWCQGFSEPEAGSDLPAMRTRAEPDGDGFRVTGQKVWTSWAGWAEWCYLLARVPTDSENPRDGITVFLIPMNREGIEVRPIDALPGPHHLNEVFFDNVRVERAEVLGEIGNGWDVVRDAISHERVGIARYARSDRVLSLVAPQVNIAEPSSLRGDWMRARIVNRVSRLVCRRTVAAQSGGTQTFAANAARLLTVRADQFAADTAADALQSSFFLDRYSDGDTPFGGMIEFVWRYAQAATIASGTTEMLQLQLVSGLRKGLRLETAPEVEDISAAFKDMIGTSDRLPKLREAVEDAAMRHALRAEMAEMIQGLDPREDFEAAMQAGEVARRAGAAALPLPIEAMLLARDGLPVVFSDETGAVEHADLFDEWIRLAPEGSATKVRGAEEVLGTQLGRFVSLTAGETIEAMVPDATETALSLVLPGFYVLGALETALDLAVKYAEDRVQFGTPIITRQAVSFKLADAAAELYGLQSLAQYSLWRSLQAPEGAIADALALRWYAQSTARKVLRSLHQVLGAIGLTYEHDLAMITAALQPRLRLPFTEPETLDRFTDAVRSFGFASLFHAEGEPVA